MLRVKFQLALWSMGALAFTALVYRPHTLHGESASPRFPPQRIVSMTLAADEIVLALVPAERILALTYLADDARYSHSVEAAGRVLHRVHANAEQVIALQPDLIIASSSAYTGVTSRSLLRGTGIPLCELPWHDSFAGVQKNILAIGRSLDALPRARRLVADMDRRLDWLRERVAGSPRPRVLYYYPGGFTAGSGTTLDEMIRRAGGLNVATDAGIHGVKQLSREALIGLNPGVILVGGAPDESQGGSVRPFLLADPSLAAIEAIRQKRVYVVPGPSTGSLSHHIVKGVERIARLLHPHAFDGAEAGWPQSHAKRR